MSATTIKAVFADLLTAPFVGSEFTAVWHAGEPLTVGIPFYRYALECSKKLAARNCRVIHSIQTNATLINDEWCNFFQESDVRIGVSIDGPAFLHDRNRKTRAGRGTHACAMRGVQRLQEHGIEFQVICVLTRYSLDYPDELFEFFSAMHPQQLCFNIDEVEGINVNSSMSTPAAEKAFRQFLERFYHLAQERSLPVREFDSLTRLILSRDYNRASRQSVPFSIVSVDADGNFSCFSPELLSMTHPRYQHFVFGNIHAQSLASMLDSPHFRHIHSDIQDGVERCRASCEYFALCGGGAPSNKVSENGTFASTETTFCRFAKRAVIDVILPKVESNLCGKN